MKTVIYVCCHIPCLYFIKISPCINQITDYEIRQTDPWWIKEVQSAEGSTKCGWTFHCCLLLIFLHLLIDWKYLGYPKDILWVSEDSLMAAYTFRCGQFFSVSEKKCFPVRVSHDLELTSYTVVWHYRIQPVLHSLESPSSCRILVWLQDDYEELPHLSSEFWMKY